MSSIYLFTGPNLYAIHQKRMHWIQEFAEKHGDENLTRCDAKISVKDLCDEIAVQPFIAEKRLVLVDGIPRMTKEELEYVLTQQHPDTILAFFEPKPDKRLGGVKELLKIATVEEYALLKGPKLQAWFREQLKLCSVEMHPEAAAYMLDMIGDDQAHLEQEISKCALYSDGRMLEKEDIERIILPAGDRQVWALMDLMGQKNARGSLHHIQRLYQQGESPYAVWNSLLWMCTQCVLVLSAHDDGIRSVGDITKKAGVSFGSAKAFSSLMRTMSKEQLSEILQRVSRYETGLKTGSYKATTDGTQELQCLIDRTILSFCS